MSANMLYLKHFQSEPTTFTHPILTIRMEDLELDSSGRQPPIELEPVPRSDSPDTNDDDAEMCCRCQCESDS